MLALCPLHPLTMASLYPASLQESPAPRPPCPAARGSPRLFAGTLRAALPASPPPLPSAPLITIATTR
ncbi:hypothetical protein E2C01_002543 [Portunus trituberculatus]|uniref:Uncharacterized protein n=1 Tax=Portunus trituberculatus TaxID=210409 RepID=A0A5B7CR13_PORTR|nr:hypothetical protein [Portunus trituberculatus]